MCLLIGQKQNAKTLDKSLLDTAFKNNSDGAGYSFVENNALKVLKFRDFETFADSYLRNHKKLSKTTPFILHFRIGTHGTSNGIYNVHPFYVDKNLVFAHNGMIHKVDNCKKRSDTRVFNDTFLKPLGSKYIINNQAVLKLIAEYIGQSKLVFLNSNKTLKIVNEKLGHWDNKTWFSNSSYKNGVCDFGGLSSNYYHKPRQLNLKRTIYKLDKCGNCNNTFSKLHYDATTNERLCGACYSMFNFDV
jgi:predicted glutamine amidotransferase